MTHAVVIVRDDPAGLITTGPTVFGPYVKPQAEHIARLTRETLTADGQTASVYVVPLERP
jgi:hypothetical protein